MTRWSASSAFDEASSLRSLSFSARFSSRSPSLSSTAPVAPFSASLASSASCRFRFASRSRSAASSWKSSSWCDQRFSACDAFSKESRASRSLGVTSSET